MENERDKAAKRKRKRYEPTRLTSAQPVTDSDSELDSEPVDSSGSEGSKRKKRRKKKKRKKKKKHKKRKKKDKRKKDKKRRAKEEGTSTICSFDLSMSVN